MLKQMGGNEEWEGRPRREAVALWSEKKGGGVIPHFWVSSFIFGVRGGEYTGAAMATAPGNVFSGYQGRISPTKHIPRAFAAPLSNVAV